MIQRLKSYRAATVDPYYNLAVEEYLLRTVAPDCCILYLWQNQNTVVIGRNQNPWKECRTALLEQDGVHLVRRLSGGGAVFHDLGNLNFTFLVPTAAYNLEKQLAVILTACQTLGIQAECSGRNDILVQGRKCSGNAFYQHEGCSYHHGTLLVDVDTTRMSRYLNPSKAKLTAKGVDSVRSRVVNLRELVPELTIPMLEDALTAAFQAVYELPAEQMTEAELNCAAVEKLTCRNRSWAWNFGRRLPFTFSCEGQFDWGGMQIQMCVESGEIKEAKVYSDAMDWQSAPALERALLGCRFVLRELQARVMHSCPEIGGDICHLLQEQEI